MTAGLLVILGLMALVMIHEAGHFLAARAVGIRATKFSLFFGPAIWKRQMGETEYRLGTIPLGGYVSLPGMFPPSSSETAERLGEYVKDIALGLDAADDRDALLTALNRLASADDPDQLARRLEVLDQELTRAIEHQSAPGGAHTALSADAWTKRVGRVQKLVTTILDDCHPRAYWRAQLWRRMTVIAAGPFVNIVVAFVVLTGVLTFFDPVLRYGIASIEKDSPAAAAGIKPSDTIVKWGGVSASSDLEQMQRAIEKSRGKDVTLVVKNADGVTRTERLSPVVLDRDKKVAAANADKGEDAATPAKRIGVNFELERTAWQRRNPVGAAGDSVQFMWLITVGQIKGLSRVVLPEGRKEISSVVGIVKIAPEVQKRDSLLTYIAVISMALAVLNLLPILPLDGGHLMFGLIEFLRRGRPLPRSAFERYSVVGIAFVLMLFVIGLSNDVGLSS